MTWPILHSCLLPNQHNRTFHITNRRGYFEKDHHSLLVLTIQFSKLGPSTFFWLIQYLYFYCLTYPNSVLKLLLTDAYII
ncbi:hypothetical protein NC651_034721 [Populus alba x Populus x berolinensis]|nr:hypothetical protein NC651_034721 [Populus alba x Populus x berolinensis]